MFTLIALWPQPNVHRVVVMTHTFRRQDAQPLQSGPVGAEIHLLKRWCLCSGYKTKTLPLVFVSHPLDNPIRPHATMSPWGEMARILQHRDLDAEEEEFPRTLHSFFSVSVCIMWLMFDCGVSCCLGNKSSGVLGILHWMWWRRGHRYRICV